ncbi:hypothetical protein KFL_003060010 [Klebsormidium nitens]|uniref:Homologous-pairing protein 2 homolog n=1 Tax=Klebsormidium nitens TaxID=105231 RepID=A0A1Y1I9S1_KLENI|nr:hypothetical protein KFL_003060010 [Klebsormidium nitens]|eukprot:GAQ86702.1 hypothetical protein KFL_003060010 [Klebsormidium nitens]
MLLERGHVFAEGSRLPAALIATIEMAPKEDPVTTVLNFVNAQNRPLNSQYVADHLQTSGNVRSKAAAEKALLSLAESGKVKVKEYGKQKVFLADQDQFDKPEAEELERRGKENDALAVEVAEAERGVQELEAEVKTLESSLTMEEIASRLKKVTDENAAMDAKLVTLRDGKVLITAEDRKKVEERFTTGLTQWRKRKRMFKELWNQITESMTKNLKDFQEELGIETDEDAGVDIGTYEQLLPKRRKF